jgi:hypothetical protein
MENINLLIGNYREYCHKKGEIKTTLILSEFEAFLVNLTKTEGPPQRVRYTQHHADYLLNCIAETSQT